MPSFIDAHEGEVATGLDLAVGLVINSKVGHLGGVEILLAVPDKGLGPSLVAEPVANVISVTGVDKDRDLLEQIGDEEVEWLGPITVEKEVAVKLAVAALVTSNLGAKSLHDLGLVQVRGDPGRLAVAEVLGVFALLTDVVHVISRSLEGANQGVVTVDGTGNAAPNALGIVAALDKRLAARQGVVHGLTFALIKDGTVVAAIVTTCHGTVLSVLSLGVGQAVADGNALEVDVTVLVGQDLGGEDGDVVASVRFTSDVEWLLSIFGEVVEEKGQQGVDVLAGSDGAGDGTTTVGVTSVDGLVNEDDRGVAVPRVVVVHQLELGVDAGGAELHEETHHGGAAGAAVQPEDDGVVLGIVSGLEEPCLRDGGQYTIRACGIIGKIGLQ